MKQQTNQKSDHRARKLILTTADVVMTLHELYISYIYLLQHWVGIINSVVLLFFISFFLFNLSRSSCSKWMYVLKSGSGSNTSSYDIENWKRKTTQQSDDGGSAYTQTFCWIDVISYIQNYSVYTRATQHTVNIAALRWEMWDDFLRIKSNFKNSEQNVLK